MEELLANIVRRQRSELPYLAPKKFITRIQGQELKNSLSSSLIKVVAGPRRAGKSTFVLQALKDKNFAYVNFEDELWPHVEDGDLIMKALQTVYGDVDFYFFDEIQLFPRWPQFLNRLHRLKKNVIVTGSNAHLMGEDLATALTGRHIEIEVLPLSFVEGLQGREASIQAFKDFLTQGGFPEVVSGNTDYVNYLSTLWDSIILKDIVKRKKIRNITGLNNVFSLLLASICSRFNIDNLARALNNEVSAPTIKKFVSYGIETFLLSELMVYNAKPRIRMKSDRKIYTIDNGFFNSRHIAISENYGTLLENALFAELCRRGFKPNRSLFYYNTRSGFEVDFLLRQEHKHQELIQACFDLGSLKTKEREYRALTQAAEELGINKLTIVTMNQETAEKYNGKEIRVIPACRWFGSR